MWSSLPETLNQKLENCEDLRKALSQFSLSFQFQVLFSPPPPYWKWFFDTSNKSALGIWHSLLVSWGKWLLQLPPSPGTLTASKLSIFYMALGVARGTLGVICIWVFLFNHMQSSCPTLSYFFRQFLWYIWISFPFLSYSPRNSRE